MIIELMMLLIAVGAGIVFVAWNNNRRRNRDVQERREVTDSTGKLKQELERTANEIIGRMENHVAHLENVLDESERNRAQLEGRVNELKNLLRKSEGQSDEIRDLLARLDDAGTEINTMQHKMDVVERKINLAMTTPLPVQQPMAIPQMPQPLVTPMMTQPVAPLPKMPAAQVTTPPATPINPLGSITMPQIPRSPVTKSEPTKKVEPPKVESETPAKNEFDKILEESLAEGNAQEKKPRGSIVLSPENKQPMKVVEADPVKIETTRKKLTEASAKIAAEPIEEPVTETQAKSLRKKRTKTSRARDVRKAALDAIREAEEISSRDDKKIPPEKILPERREPKLETTNSSVIKEMLLSGMSIEEIARETGLGRGEIELVQEMTRRQLQRR